MTINKMESWYDQEEDILDIELQKKEYWKSIELAKDIVMDIAKEGSIINIEILNASKVFSGDKKRVIEIARPAS